MAERPGAFKLASASSQFVFQNIGILFEHLKVIFPLLLLLEIGNVIGQQQGFKWIVFITFIPSIYLYACFALSWHRSSLAGPSAAHAVNPFDVPPEDRGFIGLFFGVTFLPVLAGMLLAGVFIGGGVLQSQAVIGILILLSIPAIIYAGIQFIRFSFKLPAKSLGVQLTFHEAKQAARGMISKIVLAGVLVVFVAWIVFFIYALVVGLTVGVVSAGTEPGFAGELFTTLIMAVPIMAGTIVLTAINITILSKAYQWGIQNNSPEA